MGNVLKALCALGVLALSGPTYAVVAMRAGQELKQNEFFDNGRYCLIQQADGNLVLYAKNDARVLNCTKLAHPVWATYTQGYKTIMQHDGNLVQYDQNMNPTWASNTGGRAVMDYRLEMNDYDGGLAIRDPQGNTLWSVKGETLGPPMVIVVPPTPQQPPPSLCPNGGTPSLYTVCVNPTFNSRYTYRFQACTASEAKKIAFGNGWSWGGC